MLALMLAAAVALPAPASTDYLAWAADGLWIPAGNTGKVFVFRGGKFEEIPGFATAPGRGGRIVGPSSATPGDGVVYVGSRADGSICAFDAKTLAKKSCGALGASKPDGLFYVEASSEVWATTPRDKSLAFLDAKTLQPKGTLALEGEPEGYAVLGDRVFTNLEDKDRTLVIDAHKRAIVATFEPGCGKEGPRGIAVDAARSLLFVACTDGVVSLDAKTGARKGRLETGEGVDNIDYLPARKLLYAAAGHAGRMTIANVADDGTFKISAAVEVGKGCRVVVAGPDGTGYCTDGKQLFSVKP